MYNCSMLENLENVIIDNILTQKDIDELYGYLDRTAECKPVIHEEIGYMWHPCGVTEALFEKINRLGKDLYGDQVELSEICFARYSHNKQSLPNLAPHFDNFPGGRITIDIQIKSNTDWALRVEDKRFVLKDNQALVFSGTHQAHWREPKTFDDETFVHMLFCHFTVPGVEALPQDKINEIEDFWKTKLGR